MVKGIKELTLNNKVHLCESCLFVYPDCGMTSVIFGTGGDNIAACPSYSPFSLRPYRQEKGGLLCSNDTTMPYMLKRIRDFLTCCIRIKELPDGAQDYIVSGRAVESLKDIIEKNTGERGK